MGEGGLNEKQLKQNKIYFSVQLFKIVLTFFSDVIDLMMIIWGGASMTNIFVQKSFS